MARIIQPKMISFLEYKLERDGLYQLAVAENNPTLIMIRAAQACVGSREQTGNNDGKLFELIQETVDGKAENEPYCIAGGQTVVAFAEYKTGKLSRLYASEHCQTAWRETPAFMKIPRKDLKPGDHVAWGKIGSDAGHWGIVIEVHSDFMIVIEFNTTKGNEGGKIVREGGGVYVTKRPYTTVDNMKLLGFIRPF